MAYTTINKSSDYFNTKLYTGNGVDDRSITGVGFQPDFLWIKQREQTRGHALQDSNRGATKYLGSHTTAEENTNANGVQAFESDGFQLGTDTDINQNTGSYVAWNWLANGSGSANTDGSISSTVSANTTSGFSIVSYTGTAANATVGHGLGSTPKLIIAKNLDSSGGSAEHWTVFHNSLDTNKNLYLNLTNAEDTPSPEIYRKGSFTNNVFAIGAHDRINKSGEAMIAYCFAEKTGYNKFGSYVGNGNADGPFIYTGFKPAWVMIKRTDITNNWIILDNKRDTDNPNNVELQANSSNAEDTANIRFDMLSNGWKTRATTAANNASGGTYIYMAFGQTLVGSNNIPCTAR